MSRLQDQKGQRHTVGGQMSLGSPRQPFPIHGEGTPFVEILRKRSGWAGCGDHMPLGEEVGILPVLLVDHSTPSW